MKKVQKKYIKSYYGIAILLNLVFLILLTYLLGINKGEILYIGIWWLICVIVYTIYFAIPDFNKKWEKIIGLLLPTFILSLVLVQSWNFIIIILLNLAMNGFFIWHLKKKTFANTV